MSANLDGDPHETDKNFHMPQNVFQSEDYKLKSNFGDKVTLWRKWVRKISGGEQIAAFMA